MNDLSEDVWKLVLEGVQMCVKTFEQYTFGIITEQMPIYEKMKLIRIGEKSEEELKKEAKAQAWANIQVLKDEKAFNVAAKAEKRKLFFEKIFFLNKGKILFS